MNTARASIELLPRLLSERPTFEFYYTAGSDLMRACALRKGHSSVMEVRRARRAQLHLIRSLCRHKKPTTILKRGEARAFSSISASPTLVSALALINAA